MKRIIITKSFPVLIFIISGALFIFIGQAAANATQELNAFNYMLLTEPKNTETIILAQGMGRMGCEKGGHEKNCKHKGMRHRRGMGHGMGRGPGLEGEAQCPQPRTTANAPTALYNKDNPLENNPDNIEKGRLLFQLDAQPSCTICHGSGNGLGMMSGGLNPPPRNFMCKETMEGIPDGQLFWVIKNGSPGTGMPAFSDLNDEQIWQIVLFIRQFTWQ